jgi:hypothetical protein
LPDEGFRTSETCEFETQQLRVRLLSRLQIQEGLTKRLEGYRSGDGSFNLVKSGKASELGDSATLTAVYVDGLFAEDVAADIAFGSDFNVEGLGLQAGVGSAEFPGYLKIASA